MSDAKQNRTIKTKSSRKFVNFEVCFEKFLSEFFTPFRLVVPIEDQETTVADFMLYKYQRRLRYPDWPCIIERRLAGKDKRPRNSFHPMEFLEVVEGQRVDTKKQTPELVGTLVLNWF